MSANSWKNLPQDTKFSKKKFLELVYTFLRFSLFIIPILGLSYYFYKSDLVKQPFRCLYFASDGTLNKSWFVKHVELPFGKDLITIPLEKLKEDIIRYSQVSSVEITREFPSALHILIKEKMPCAKMMIVRKGKKVIGLISSKGEIFSPINYTRKAISEYPAITHVKKKLIERKTILGFEAIEKLLSCLQLQAPDFYQNITQISLEHFDPFLEKQWWTVDILIQKRMTFTFSLNNVQSGLHKLRSILQALSPQQKKSLRRLDISLTNPVIEFEH